MKLIDKRDNSEMVSFYKLQPGDGFERDGVPYMKTCDEYAFNLENEIEEEIGDAYIQVTPLELTITIEK